MSPVSEANLSLVVNGERQRAPDGCTVEQLITLLGLQEKRIAVAVNRDVVPRSAFPAHSLATGDQIEILEAVGGG